MVNSLDYETEQSYRLTIQVRDLGENSLARFLTIDILIVDENDNRPQAFLTFVQPLINDSIISINENTPIGQILAYVSISDQDSGLNGEMSYRIEQGYNLIGIRTIDQKSFLLIVEQFIDRENFDFNQNEKFILLIYDHGNPSKNLRLEYQILIIDENDSPPVFNQSIQCNIQINPAENQSLGQIEIFLFFHRKISFVVLDDIQPLFQVHATDLDLGENGRISYSILPPYDDTFLINDQGEIFYSDVLNQSSYYHIRIMAIDHGKSNQLNSTQDCYLSILTKENLIENETKIFDDDKQIFKLTLPLFEHYSYIIIGLFIFFLFIILIIITICLTFCLHALLFNHRKKFKQKKISNCSRQLNFYDTVHRKSPFMNDDSGCSSSKLDDNDDVTSEERERLVHLNTSDQTSCESSDSMNKQIRILNKVKKKRFGFFQSYFSVLESTIIRSSKFFENHS